MHDKAARPHLFPMRWLRYLHIFYAGVFGLVLPFVCWGAEATPGHPHLRAHFVFLPPAIHGENPLPAAENSAQTALQEASSALASGEHTLCSLPTPGAPSSNATTPVGQSNPLVSAVTLLLLTAFGAQITPVRRDRGGFTHRASALYLFTPPFAITTPPPR